MLKTWNYYKISTSYKHTGICIYYLPTRHEFQNEINNDGQSWERVAYNENNSKNSAVWHISDRHEVNRRRYVYGNRTSRVQTPPRENREAEEYDNIILILILIIIMIKHYYCNVLKLSLSSSVRVHATTMTLLTAFRVLTIWYLFIILSSVRLPELTNARACVIRYYNVVWMVVRCRKMNTPPWGKTKITDDCLPSVLFSRLTRNVQLSKHTHTTYCFIIK